MILNERSFLKHLGFVFQQNKELREAEMCCYTDNYSCIWKHTTTVVSTTIYPVCASQTLWSLNPGLKLISFIFCLVNANPPLPSQNPTCTCYFERRWDEGTCLSCDGSQPLSSDLWTLMAILCSLVKQGDSSCFFVRLLSTTVIFAITPSWGLQSILVSFLINCEHILENSSFPEWTKSLSQCLVACHWVRMMSGFPRQAL